MIAVSGATGFLGAHVVCTLLTLQKKVLAFKRARSNMQEFNYIFNYRFEPNQKAELLKNLTWIEVDILDIPSLEEAFTNANEVYHCAAIVSFKQKDYNLLMKVNVEGTTNMVNIALSKGIKKFCYVSSVAALGRRKSGELIDENTHWEDSKLNSNYAVSKYKAELEVWRAKEEGLNVCIVNPTIILGVGNFNKGGANLIKAVYNRIPFYTLGVNGYVDVEDVANIMINLMENNVFNQRFILVSECITNQQLFTQIALAFNLKPPSIQITKTLAEIAWRVIGLLRLFFKIEINITKETARSSINKSFYNNQKIKDLIGFSFKPVNQTINQSAKAYLSLVKN